MRDEHSLFFNIIAFSNAGEYGDSMVQMSIYPLRMLFRD